MKTMAKAVLLLLLGAGAVAQPGSAVAADRALARPATGNIHALPFPRSPRAQAVWAERACWNACQSVCTAALPKCFARESQGLCLKRNDRCDRGCQSDCRTRGGPYVGALFAAPDWLGDDP